MASISTEPNGRKRIQFVDGNRVRKTIRLGDVSMRNAERFKWGLEALIGARITGASVDSETSRWLADLPDDAHDKLATAGLASARNGERATVGAFIDGFVANRPDVKPQTLQNMQQVRQWLVKYFGEGRDLRTITPADAEDWRAFMLHGGLGENTIRRHIGRARQLFKSAIRRGLVRHANPFEGMAATVRADKARQFFVTREATQKVIDACPDAQWRLMVALSRYGGLRCPSEHLSLKWGDVDWARNRVRVPSPKTEHHAGKDCRMIPLFPELREHLQQVFDEAEPGTEHVITRYRDHACNLRTHFGRIIRKAGLLVWEKPWHNMRATRQTELCERYPVHVVCAWLGNSKAVAMEHYLQVTDTHYEQAAHNPAQSVTEMVGTGRKAGETVVQNQSVFPNDSETCDTLQNPYYPRQDSNL